MAKERIAVICPGRGTYTRNTLGYLKTYSRPAKSHITWMDNHRKSAGFTKLTELDSLPFKSKIHMAGEHASPLIYACGVSDFLSIDQNTYEIVAITGNSMGWYTSLALSGALNLESAYHLIQIMGSMMKDGLIGGQIIYPVVDDNWQIDNSKKESVIAEIKKVGSYVSIYLGGYLVIGGEQKSLNVLLKNLPVDEKYPFQIPFHAAFHTPLLESISQKAFELLSETLFKKPSIPLIDGRGHIWSTYSTNMDELRNYTLGYQIVKPFDFSSSVSVTMKEFCPDKLVLLGPGNSLGGALGQIMIENNWQGVSSKKDFLTLQNESPFLISMGIPDQRKLVC